MKRTLLFCALYGIIFITNAQVTDTPVYLDKDGALFISIKSRVVSDMRKSFEISNPESQEHQQRLFEMADWTEEKRDELVAVFQNSILEYTSEVKLDNGIFVMCYDGFRKKDDKAIAEEYDIRIRYLGGNKYAAEFWEDGIAVNSEAHALEWAKELSEKYPDGDTSTEAIKETYANTRKSIEEGTVERYFKVMAFLYTVGADDTITFHDPFQKVVDFK